MEHGLLLMPCAISARSRKRRAWSFIQPAWNAASWRLSQNTSRRRRSAWCTMSWVSTCTSETVIARTDRAGSRYRPPSRCPPDPHDRQLVSAPGFEPLPLCRIACSSTVAPGARSGDTARRGRDARLPAGGAHDLPGADLLPRIDGLAAAFAPRPREPGFVVGPRRPRPQPDAHHVRLPLGGLADVDPERNARARQHPAQPHELVFGKRVHGIDDDRAEAGRRLVVPEREASADDGVEEALRLAGPGAGGDEGRPACGDRADGAFLVAVEMGDVPRDPLAQMRVEQPFGDQRGDRCALPERPRETDVRPLEERRSPGLVEREERSHLREQVRVGEGVGGELVAEEASDDVLGVGDGVQGHGAVILESMGVRISHAVRHGSIATSRCSPAEVSRMARAMSWTAARSGPRRLSSTAITATDRSQDRFRRSPVDPELFSELIKRYAVSQPVKELLHRKPAATKARCPAHAIRIDPNRLFESHHVLHRDRAVCGSGYEYLIPVPVRHQAID